MRYCIAVDSGGSKTDLALFDTSGRVIARHHGLGCNIMDIGREEALRRMESMVRELAVLSPDPVCSFYGGIAGIIPFGPYLDGMLGNLLPEAIIRVEDDGLEIISGAIGHKDGCCMICGTGSSLYIRKDGITAGKIGGKGYLIDTGGSGFDLGRDAFCMAYRSLEHRCGSSILPSLIEKKIGLPPESWMRTIYGKERDKRQYIASFSNVVFEGYAAKDEVCAQILHKGATNLGGMTKAAERYFDDTFVVILSGGIVFSHPEYVELIRQESSEKAQLILAKAPPLYGAAVEAMWNLGLEIDSDFQSHFMKGIA